MKLTRRVALAGLAAGLPSVARARIDADAVNTVGESLDEIRAKGRLKVAVYQDFAPFSATRDGALVRPTGVEEDEHRPHEGDDRRCGDGEDATTHGISPSIVVCGRWLR